MIDAASGHGSRACISTWIQSQCSNSAITVRWLVLSSAGCTHGAELLLLSTRRNIACVPAAGLEQWEQEVKLFVALKQLRLFRQHKLWKAFKCWKSAIDSTKLAAAKVSLNKQLFLLSPVFQQPLQQFHTLCHELSSMRLHSIQPGKVSLVVAGHLCRTVSL
jgi:hypothetical protein